MVGAIKFSLPKLLINFRPRYYFRQLGGKFTLLG